MSMLVIAAGIAGAIAVGLVLTGFAAGREKAAKRAGTYANAFVMVEDDGSARELTAQERDVLNHVDYSLGDGAIPYIKESYDSRKLDGRIGGYLERRKLPRKVASALSTK